MKQKKIVLAQLKAMGFKPVEIEDVGYGFTYEGMNYLYMSDDGDEQFLRIVIPYLFEVTDENRVAVLEAMHETGKTLKYSKVCIMSKNAVWAMYEHRLTSVDDLPELLEHIILVLEATARFFCQNISNKAGAGLSDELEEISDEALEAELQKMLESIEDEEVSN